MKIIKYSLCTRVNYGTEEKPKWEERLSPVELEWNEGNVQIAIKEAYGGVYTVEEKPDPFTAPTRMDAIEAQLAYTAMMTDTLLEV